MTRDWAAVDLYAVLGVDPDASADEISDAFRSAAKRLHPDVAGDDGPEAERFKEMTAAYEVLSDPRRRRDYDSVRASRRAEARRAPRAAASAPTTTGVDPGGPYRAERWTPGRVRAATIGGALAFVAGILAAVGILVLQASEAADRRDRVERVGTAAVGAPATRLAYFAGPSARPYLGAVPDGAATDFPAGAEVTVRVRSDDPLAVAVGPQTPPEFDLEVRARVVSTTGGAAVAYGDPGSVPIVVADPTSNRSAGLVDGGAVTLLVDANDPTDVLLDESHTARNLTFWIVALKLLVAGPLLVWFARSRVRGARRAVR